MRRRWGPSGWPIAQAASVEIVVRDPGREFVVAGDRGLLTRAEVPLAVSIPLVLASGALAGGFNGALVTRLGLPSLVVTLGTMALFRGIGYILRLANPR